MIDAMFLLLALLLLIFLPSPWNLVGALTSGALGVAEVGYWQRQMRRRKVATGVENLVGATGEVSETCAPLGQVRLHGELWEARSTQELRRGTPVRVVAVDGLTLEVEPTNGASKNVNRLGSLAVVLVAALALAGCGGGDDETSAESWASSVCGGLSTWLTEVEEALQSLTDEGLAINEEDVQTAVDQVDEATTALVEDLDELGPPETEGGEEAQRELESLSTELRSEADTVREALDSETGAAELASTVSMSVSTGFAEISSSLAELRGVDPAGELEDGFENADECDSFREQVEDLGS